MTDPLAGLLAFCTSLPHGTMLVGTDLAAMLMLGVVGSLPHCGPMCGPFVLGQVVNRLACVPCDSMTEFRRLRSGLLPQYHLGRMLTYSMLGAAAGTLGLGLEVTWQPLRSIVLLAAAATLLLSAWNRRLAGLPVISGLLNRGMSRFRNQSLRRVPPGSVVFGMILGLLPCGLVYTALMAAAATASPLWGAAGMAMFGAGTVPLLAALGVAGNAGAVLPWLRRIAPAILSINAAVLFVAALGLVSP
jgi:uncharacterized protein